MCGICGFAATTPLTEEELQSINNTMQHRGPDDSGIWMHKANTYYIALAHRRLSILDLSKAGHQPMISQDGKYVIAFNGEIYNFCELRKELEELGYNYHSNSDTEVLLTAYQEWGPNCLDKLDGMFAFAIYEAVSNTIFLARDRVGKKPLYYYWENSVFLFASELKALMKHPLFQKKIRKEVIAKYMCNRYIESPETIFENTYKLEAGCSLTWKNGEVAHARYYSHLSQFSLLSANPITNFDEAKQNLAGLIDKSVAKRMVANVPIGVFLSGGIDSAIVAATAAKLSHKPLQSFTIGFHAKERDEAPQARKIAQYIGTDHVEYYVDELDLLQLVEDIPQWYDEPFADSSQIPTMLVCKLARQDVTVALSGDGGDEFFCGYSMYDWAHLAQRLDGIAGLAYQALHLPGIRNLPIEKILPSYARALLNNRNANTKVQLFADVREEFVQKLVKGTVESPKFNVEKDISSANWQEKRMLLDIVTYLPDEVLAKVDRASMKYSLEVRAPLLDRSVTEYSFRLPHNFKYYKGEKKWILKQIAYDLIPSSLLDMPKRGFGVPLAKWLRGPLKNKVTCYARKEILVKQDIFDAEQLFLLIDKVNQNDSSVYSGVLWAFLTFQMWYQTYIEDLW